MPLPTITMSASAGSCSVVRCPSKNSLGSLCQKELLDFGVGRVARSCFMLRELSIAAKWMDVGLEGKAAVELEIGQWVTYIFPTLSK